MVSFFPVLFQYCIVNKSVFAQFELSVVWRGLSTTVPNTNRYCFPLNAFLHFSWFHGASITNLLNCDYTLYALIRALHGLDYAVHPFRSELFRSGRRQNYYDAFDFWSSPKLAVRKCRGRLCVSGFVMESLNYYSRLLGTKGHSLIFLSLPICD